MQRFVPSGLLGRLRARRSRARGAASVEAAVALPVFVIVFTSVIYVRDQALAKQEAENEARTCAWLYSANNCSFDGGAVPESCRAVLRETSGGDLSPDVARAVDEGKKAIADSAKNGGSIASIVGSLLGPALAAAFGRSVEARVDTDVRRPMLYGGETQAVAGRFQLACNLAPRKPEDVAAEAWRLFSP